MEGDLPERPAFTRPVTGALTRLATHGARATIARMATGQGMI